MRSDDEHQHFIVRVLDAAVRIGLAIILVLWCFRIVEPFIAPIVWGVIIAIGTYPGYRYVETRLSDRTGRAAFVYTLLLLAVLIVPTAMLGSAMVDSAKELAEDLADGTLTIPPPSAKVAEWPVVGERVSAIWTQAADNLSAVLTRFEPQLEAFRGWLLGGAAKAGLGGLMFIFSVIIAGVLHANVAGCRAAAHRVAARLFGARGRDLVDLSHATITSVARGILGIALIQTILAGMGFLAMGIPGAGLWALVCLVLAVVQIDILLILIPMSIWAFSSAGTGAAVVFLIWNIAVGLINNVLKPILLGRGVDAPMVVIFIGAIGGLMVSGIIGLFVGAVVLVLGFKLFQAWLEYGETAEAAQEES